MINLILPNKCRPQGWWIKQSFFFTKLYYEDLSINPVQNEVGGGPKTIFTFQIKR